ncbi:DNA-processing protein DprA [Candidatus Gracilibacteria bacterium]|nr:DNA-processing protein DprA [Candidatus Gracilibacteria bacterium]
MGDNKFLLAFQRGWPLTHLRFQKLVRYFQGNWERIWNAELPELVSAGLDAAQCEKFLHTKHTISPEQELERLRNCGARSLCIGQEGYPELLSQIYAPPPVLFVRGVLEASDFPSLSVVGARRATVYGKRATEKIVGTVAREGITIVSGLAFGIDTYAHEVAVSSGAKTIGVLGHGIDQVRPVRNAQFAERILAEGKGAIISEYLPGIEARPEYFPIRNRIVAGLSRATLVIEAAERSGSLITAFMALEQGRDVFAVPGEIFSRMSVGTNMLLSQGAFPALSGKEILDSFGMLFSRERNKKPPINLTEEEKSIVKLFERTGRMHMNDLLRQAPFSSAVTSSSLSLLELKGVVVHLGNQIYTCESHE